MPLLDRVYCDVERGLVGYATSFGSPSNYGDFLLIYSSANPSDEPGSAPASAVVAAWKKAAIDRNTRVRRRTIFFSPQIDLAFTQRILEFFFMDPDHKPEIEKIWGQLCYWPEALTGEQFPAYAFPRLSWKGSGVGINVGKLRLTFTATPPGSLDDFDIGWDDTHARLTLTTATATRARLVHDGQEHFNGRPAFELPLLPPGRRDRFYAGAVGLELPVPTGTIDTHPLGLVGFCYQAAKDARAGHELFRATLFRSVISAARPAMLALDPRDAVGLDGPGAKVWDLAKLNSRLQFAGTVLTSTLFDTRGRAAVLTPGGDERRQGVARLGFVFGGTGNTPVTDGTVLFHPDGPFDRVLPQTELGASNILPGASATEYVEYPRPKPLQFQPGGPARFEWEAGQSVLKSLEGRAIASWLEFPPNSEDALFFSQPTDAPLFVSAGAKVNLVRHRSPYGSTGALTTDNGRVAKRIPIFPWAGRKTSLVRRRAKSAAEEDKLAAFERTHLAEERRRRVAAQSVADLGPTQFRALSFSQTLPRTITPQGIVAEVEGQFYRRLYFGKPEPDPDANAPVVPEFQLAFSESGGGTAFTDLQRVLRSSELFLVVDRPTLAGAQAIDVSATITLRKFSLNVNFQVNPVAPDLGPAVILVKYFRGKSLAELVADPATWGGRDWLAPFWSKGASKHIADLAQVNGKVPLPLAAVWNNPDWQGVLLLNLTVKEMPDLLEALTPAMAKGGLRVHHFGLDYLPVQREDVETPRSRVGSTFGLVRYDAGVGLPDMPKADDTEPGPGNPGERLYSMVVETLEVAFAESRVSRFEARVKVGFSHLFWDKTSLAAPLALGAGKTAMAKMLTLDGTYECRPKDGGGTEDVFNLRSPDEFEVVLDPNSWLRSFVIRRAQLSVTAAERDQANNKLTKLITFLGFDGVLTLDEKLSLPLFKVRSITAKEVGLTFTYRPAGTQDRFTCGFDAGRMSADVDFEPDSKMTSLLSTLPLEIKGVRVALGKLLRLSELNFAAVGFSGLQDAFHFGLEFELNLGSLGNLMPDVRGLRVPAILGWGGGATKGVAFGIQFPKFDGRIDLGIQQFARLRADKLAITPCKEANGGIAALAITAVNGKLVLFGREWPQGQVNLLIFVPVSAGRKVGWALGYKGNDYYVGAAQRLRVPAGNSVEKLVAGYKDYLDTSRDPCDLIKKDFAGDISGWTMVGEFKLGSVADVQFAIADHQSVYGLRVSAAGIVIDVLYRKVTQNVGCFAAEVSLPEAQRTIQLGAVSVRLPVIRVEIYTDGGFLVDFGFPWNHDFSRSAQVEVGIFLGSGGFYYGRTTASASSLLAFPGGYGYGKAPDIELEKYRAIRVGFALRVGLGRSFTVGIMTGEASITIFGGIEGAAAYLSGVDTNPPLYALRGYVGLMVDISARVSFAIVQARAQIRAYAMVGIELRRVLATNPQGALVYLNLPLVIFAEIGLYVAVEVEIGVGCAKVSIRLEFSATWRIEERIGPLKEESVTQMAMAPKAYLIAHNLALVEATTITWPTTFRAWKTMRDLDLYVTVLPCMANPPDVGQPAGDPRSAAVGQMLIPVDQNGGMLDLARLFAGWVLFPGETTSIDGSRAVSLGLVNERQKEFKKREQDVWSGFDAAVDRVIGAHLAPKLQLLPSDASAFTFASAPFWPGLRFTYVGPGAIAPAAPARVVFEGQTFQADQAGFREYCKCLVTALLPEIERQIIDKGTTPKAAADVLRDPDRFLTWDQLWTEFCQPPAP